MSMHIDPERSPLMVQAATTAHFALQSARAAITTESVGRATLYLSSVSGALIAMGFLAPLLQGQLILIQINVVLLGALFLLGLVTCVRLTQLAIDDTTYQRNLTMKHSGWQVIFSTNARTPQPKEAKGATWM